MQKSPETKSSSLVQLAEQIYQEIARQFPICCSSDEFYFFPQVIANDSTRWGWDDFSADAIEQFVVKANHWRAKLELRRNKAAAAPEKVDAELLLEMLQTLSEQLVEVAPHSSQPTFHLSIVVAGLSEALESSDPGAWRERIAGLPAFLQRAGEILVAVPELFMVLGEKMLADLRPWLMRSLGADSEHTNIEEALTKLSSALQHCPIRKSFILPLELFERLLSTHLGCGCPLDSAEQELRSEYAEMEEVLTAEAERLVPGLPWQQAESHLPFQVAPENKLQQLYQPELLRLEKHARTVGLIPPLAGGLQPELAAVPESMSAIRASDAYSARVGHPASGGIFYLYEHGMDRAGPVGRTLEYRMTAAHEAWPGHHLLDVCRWNLPSAIRRPLERPLFYEGWACFAEQLMAITGYFNGPWDRFLLARRRIERAARGLVDIGLQSGRLRLDEAAELLVRVGYVPQKAAEVVPKYALRPGYQVCYTLGLRRMLQLREQAAEMEIGIFARQVLTQGEIGFAAFQQVLERKGD